MTRLGYISGHARVGEIPTMKYAYSELLKFDPQQQLDALVQVQQELYRLLLIISELRILYPQAVPMIDVVYGSYLNYYARLLGRIVNLSSEWETGVPPAFVPLAKKFGAQINGQPPQPQVGAVLITLAIIAAVAAVVGWVTTSVATDVVDAQKQTTNLAKTIDSVMALPGAKPADIINLLDKVDYKYKPDAPEGTVDKILSTVTWLGAGFVGWKIFEAYRSSKK